MSQTPTTPPTAGHHAPAPRNGFGITALVLAIVGAVFGLIPLTGLVALILGALAVLFGLLGVGRVRRGAATNRVMTWIATGLGVGVAALGIVGIAMMFAAIQKFDSDMQEIAGIANGVANGGTPVIPGTQTPDAAQDVNLSGCSTRTEYGTTTVEADLTVTNSSDRSASYWVVIAVDDPVGNRLGEIYAIRNELGAGQSAQLSGWDASTMLGSRPGAITCRVVDVDRMAF
ncbi:hypothetical protein [Saccharopolyspora sp. NPDC002376]